VFLWQIPHFLAIAWIYRDDYAQAGLRMLPALDRDGNRTAWRMVAYCVALLIVSEIPSLRRVGRPNILPGSTCAGRRLFDVLDWLLADPLSRSGALRAAHVADLFASSPGQLAVG
jgi:heme O synthase-like polyprenyltransferase